MTSPMPKVMLPREEWEYICVLIASDVRNDRAKGGTILSDYHEKILQKIQPAAQWDDEEEPNV